MSSSIRFTPLLGSKSGPDLFEDSFCGLLEINQYKILLDCGLPEIFPFELGAFAKSKYLQAIGILKVVHKRLEKVLTSY